MTCLIVFLAQFAYILLLGLQQLNVVGRHYAHAAAVSFLLGWLGYTLTASIAIHKEATPFVSPVWWAFVLSGPIGICCAIWLHPRMRDWIERK